MAVSGSASIFISYAHKDAAELANRLHQDLESSKFEVWLDKPKLHGGATWTAEIEQALDNAEIVLALLSAGSYASEICRAEQLRALRHGKCVIPLRVQRGTPSALSIPHSNSKEILPLHLEAKQYRDFSQASTYTKEFDQLLADIGQRKGVELKPEFRETYVTAPPLPANYIERPEALDSLRNAIITEGSGRNIALTAVEGMGGHR